MPDGSIIPPDVREELKRQQAAGEPPGAAGIGGGAKENVAAAQHRRTAMGVSEPPPEAPEEEETEEAEELSSCPNEECNAKLDDEWQYCARCGFDLVRGGAAKRLGITFTEEDVTDYLFKGFIVRELAILGNHTLTVKTSQAEDMEEVDDFLMNGDWAKDSGGREKKISEFHMRNKNQLCTLAANLLKVDGQSIGEKLSDRIAYLSSKGSAFVDLAMMRVVLFQRAFTEYLRKKDTVLGS